MTMNKIIHARPLTAMPRFAVAYNTAPKRIVMSPNHDNGLGRGSPRTKVSKKAHGMGTNDRITMNVSTFEVATTTIPAVIVTKNMPAAGKKCKRRSRSNASTSITPALPSARVTMAAAANCKNMRVHTKGNCFTAHLFTTTKPEEQSACPQTSSNTEDRATPVPFTSGCGGPTLAVRVSILPPSSTSNDTSAELRNGMARSPSVCCNS
mmetsp:Transcript_9494/g.27455  ORF Transcript_9494/g.27455 Transcript_9494/m.27455 type:complete len:208 (+) Transcript_9494:130-753(+)